jgi:hypothetical protein
MSRALTAGPLGPLRHQVFCVHKLVRWARVVECVHATIT